MDFTALVTIKEYGVYKTYPSDILKSEVKLKMKSTLGKLGVLL